MWIGRALREIAVELREIAKELRKIEHDLHPKLAQGQVTFDMKTIQVGQTSLATLSLVGSDGNPFTIDSTYSVAYQASNPANVSVGTVNPDGSALITGVNPDPGDTIGAVVTRPDGVQITLTPDTLVIVPVTPPVTLASGAVVLT